MATAATQPMTAEEFHEWANRPENDDKLFELEDGEPVEMSRPAEIHGVVCWLAAMLLGNYLFRRGAGYVCTNDTGLIVKRGPDTVRGPDLMVFLETKPFSSLERKYSERIPELIVEVLSPSDRRGKTLRRIEQYHKRGIPLVWLIDPEEMIVTVYRPNEFPKVLDEIDELTGNGVLPEFTCRVADLFALPGTTAPAP